MTGRIDRNEDGFSIIELIVAFMVMAIIIAPLSTSVIIGMSSIERSNQRTTDTTDQQILASYFTHDVQSADDVQTASATCGAAVGTPVLRLHWLDPVGSVDKIAAYVVTSGNELQRVYCEGGATVNSVVVVHTLSGAPTVACDGAGCPAAGGTPREVSMHVVTVGSTNAALSHDIYEFDLSATRRVTA